MSDQKKIELLKQFLSASCRGFRTCPYNDTEWDAIKTVFELLEEQEPVRPRWTHPTVDKNVMMCGSCGIEIPLGKPNYCPWCGRKVQWDA